MLDDHELHEAITRLQAKAARKRGFLARLRGDDRPGGPAPTWNDDPSGSECGMPERDPGVLSATWRVLRKIWGMG